MSAKIKVILIGDSGVGKTSIYNLYHNKTGKTPVDSTIQPVIHQMTIVVGNSHRTVELVIVDTAGDEKFHAVSHQFYRNAAIAILVYDISKRNTFDSITKHWIADVKKHSHNDSVKWILLGNKVDLEDKREVELDMIGGFARDHEMSMIEMSANRDEDCQRLDSVIRTTVEQIIISKDSASYHRAPEQCIIGDRQVETFQLESGDRRKNDTGGSRCFC